ncbi:hypothetical protein [Teichococcus vastitatis]|jgi:hypothetical protein|uniref:Uncharacterized protein n=1 Tax=Teichococcus vastitatis TaxID=2307076 RepID=A0ABS9W9P2_9PROT|nr:hypothetical protein [Pseudoroseomonas vastitatis]MCI0755708.1 hypothetical protein [Pseudoroseomonas vastitatis]
MAAALYAVRLSRTEIRALLNALDAADEAGSIYTDEEGDKTGFCPMQMVGLMRKLSDAVGALDAAAGPAGQAARPNPVREGDAVVT